MWLRRTISHFLYLKGQPERIYNIVEHLNEITVTFSTLDSVIKESYFHEGGVCSH